MNNPIDLALTRIRHSIIPEMLELAFKKREVEEIGIPIYEMVLNKVIRDFVIKDMNIYGGKQTEIVLLPEFKEKLQMTKQDTYMNTGPFSLYRIPPEAREHGALVEVHGVRYRGNYSGYVPNSHGYSGGVDAISLGQNVLDSRTFASSPPRPNVELMSGDLIKLTPSQHSGITWVLSCRIGYDKDFTNLNTSSLDTFCDLCVAATKLYIRNQLLFTVNKAYVESGMELDQVKLIIDDYGSANETYKELLDTMAGAMTLDPARLREILQYML